MHKELGQILATTIKFLGADFGTVQLYDAKNLMLRIVAHRGFKRRDLDYFGEVCAKDKAACARVLRSGRRIIIEDVEKHAAFAPHRTFARSAGFRAVLSAPLLALDGRPLGVISTHFRHPHRPDELELPILDLFSRRAADLIERYDLEQALSAREEKLQLALRAAAAGTWSWDAKTDESSWDTRFQALYGLSSKHPRTLETWVSCLHKDDKARVLAAIKKVGRRLADGSWDIEFRAVRPNGTVVWHHGLGHATRDEKGRFAGLTGIDTDITPRKQAEAALAESHERIQAIVATAVEGIVTIDESGCIESMNPAALSTFGYAMNEILGHNVKMLMPKPYAEAHDSYLSNYLRTGKRKIIGIGREVQGRHKDGTVFPIDLSVTEIRVNGRRKFTAFIRDITARKQSETALREQADRYRTLVEAAPDAIVVVKDGRIVFVNGEALRLLGAAVAEDVQGKSFLKFFPSHRHELIQERMDGFSAVPGTSPLIDEDLVRMDGGIRWVRIAVARFTENKELATQFILRDITEHRLLERELLATVEREQRKFGQDLHDGLGQRLTGLEMLSHRLAKELENDVSNRAERARQLNRELRETVTEARLLSRGLAPVPLDGDGLRRGLAELAARTGRLAGVDCRFTCDPPVALHDVTAATHLYRIAQEAVNNALKHGKAKRVDLHLTESAQGIQLRVENNGRALRPERLRNAAGMGLHVMRYRAELIGANVKIAPRRPRGARVVCFLPKNP